MNAVFERNRRISYEKIRKETYGRGFSRVDGPVSGSMRRAGCRRHYGGRVRSGDDHRVSGQGGDHKGGDYGGRTGGNRR